MREELTPTSTVGFAIATLALGYGRHDEAAVVPQWPVGEVIVVVGAALRLTIELKHESRVGLRVDCAAQLRCCS
jgi:hypothetical protein